MRYNHRRGGEFVAKKKSNKVKHMKTGKAELKLHFKGKRLELRIVIPPEMEKILARRLARRLA
jgi:hypothetical protein